MKKILYSAVDNNGKSKNGFIEAESNAEALEILSSDGYSEIKFHDDGLLSLPRDDLESLSNAELETMANLEVRGRRNLGFGSFMLGVIVVNKFVILVGVGLVIWGILENSIYLTAFGTIAVLAMPVVSAWNYRVVSKYNSLLIAFAEGRWIEARKLIRSLRKHMKAPQMEFDLDIREACANSENVSLDATIIILEKWHSKLEETSPGYYESRVAFVYHHFGHYDRCVDLMRNAYFNSSLSPTLVTDLALVEARLGNLNKAKALVETINSETLPVIGFPFLEWIQGLIQKEDASTEANNHFLLAISGLLSLEGGPAIWPSLAVCIGDYAIFSSEKDSKAQAEKLLSTVWDVLKAHGEKPLLEKLTRLYPSVCA